MQSKGKTDYERPMFRKLSTSQVKKRLLNHLREFLELILPGRKNISDASLRPRERRDYECPRLRKLTPEQAKLLLIGHASAGDQKARDVLELLFPEPDISTSENPSVSLEEGRGGAVA